MTTWGKAERSLTGVALCPRRHFINALSTFFNGGVMSFCFGMERLVKLVVHLSTRMRM